MNKYAYRIDNKVVVVMLVTSIIFLLLMAFRYKTKEPCGVVDFSYRTYNDDLAYTREPVYFSAELKYNAESWEWDFGDKTKHDKTTGPDVKHQYNVPGQYTVRLIVNGKCEFARTLNVNQREDKGKKLYPMPLWPAEPLVAGQEYSFDDATTGAVTWSWYFDDEPKRLQKNIVYLFNEPGTHKVTLVLNDDMDNNKIIKVFNVGAPPVQNSQPLPASQGNGGSGGRPGMPVITDKPVGDPMDVIAAGPSIPTVSDNVLKGYVLGINGSGYGEIKKYLKNMNFANCTILFNDRNIIVEQLKENIKFYELYPQSLEVKQSLNTDNNIIQMDIKATLKPRSRWLVKDKKRDFPF